MRKLLPILLFALLATSCASRNIQDTDALDASEGVLVISVAQDIVPPAAGGNTLVYLDNKTPATLLSARKGLLSLIGAYEASDYPDVEGRLYVIKLPAGEHQLTGWQIGMGNSFIHPSRRPSPVSFTVRPGSTTYVGRIHMRFDMGRDLLGMTVVQGGWPEFRDARIEDLALLAQNYPELSRKVTLAPLPPGPWGISSGIIRQTEPPVLIPRSK